jgi:hypothetical protein
MNNELLELPQCLMLKRSCDERDEVGHLSTYDAVKWI